MRTNRLWIPTGAVPDEPLSPDCEGALVDAEGHVVFQVNPESRKECADCGAVIPSDRVLFLCDTCINEAVS